MAQVKIRLLLIVSFVLGAAQVFAQNGAAPAGAAEEARRLQRAVQENPGDPMLHYRLSQAYAVLDRPRDAFDAVERALALSPDSVEFLRARATLATWLGDYDRARETYGRLLALAPDDADLLLSLARVSAWAGRTDAAVDAYGRYLRARPEAAAVWIELARTEQWRGNYGAALDALHRYQGSAGKDGAYSRERAAVLARAGRPAEALAILEPMLRQHPDDYELNLTRTVALANQRRARDASHALETLRRIRPEAGDTRTAERIVQSAVSSSVDPGVNLYSDASTLEVQRISPRATVALPSGTTFAAGSEHETLSAHQGSGLEIIGSSGSVRHDHVWVSGAQQLGPVNVYGRFGEARAAGRDLTTYALGADFAPTDGLKLSIERSFGFFVVSPRTVGLGLEQLGHRARAEWSPNVRTLVAADFLYQTLSDGNRRWELTVAPRRSVARTERLNLDLGAVVTQLRTRTNFDHGYYDPSRYEYYAATATPYWKVSESIGVGLSLALGTQRDDFSPAFRLGGQATADATFGIFNPWAVRVTGGGMFNQRLGSGAFRGYGASVSLIRRF